MQDDEARKTASIVDEIKQSKPFPSKSQEAYIALLRTADDSKRFVSRVLESSGVTLQQYNVLRILRGAGDEGLPTLVVAERMVERTPGVTRLIDRMERKGWVTRRRCTEDRRRVWCQITDEGLELLSHLDAPLEGLNDVIGGVLSESELVDFLRYMDRIRASLNASLN